MDGFIETTFGIPPVEDVVTLRRFMIALLFLRAYGCASKGNFIGANHLSLRHKSQSALTLYNEDLVGLHWLSK